MLQDVLNDRSTPGDVALNRHMDCLGWREQLPARASDIKRDEAAYEACAHPDMVTPWE